MTPEQSGGQLAPRGEEIVPLELLVGEPAPSIDVNLLDLESADEMEERFAGLRAQLSDIMLSSRENTGWMDKEILRNRIYKLDLIGARGVFQEIGDVFGQESLVRVVHCKEAFDRFGRYSNGIKRSQTQQLRLAFATQSSEELIEDINAEDRLFRDGCLLVIELPIEGYILQCFIGGKSFISACFSDGVDEDYRIRKHRRFELPSFLLDGEEDRPLVLLKEWILRKLGRKVKRDDEKRFAALTEQSRSDFWKAIYGVLPDTIREQLMHGLADRNH